MNRPTLSASNLYAAALCPGKIRLETGLAGEDSVYSKRGTGLHRFFQTPLDRSGLSIEDRELLVSADEYARTFLGKFADYLAEFRCMVGTIQYEHEIELPGIVPGHPDTIYSYNGGDYAAILDLKSGVLAVEHAQDNWQLAVYASNLFQRTPFKVCGVAIIAPDAMGPRMTSAIYTADQLPGVLAEIERVKAATEQPDAPLVPGPEQCRFCRAKAICPAYTDFAPVLKALPLAFETLDNETLVKLHEIIARAESLKKQVSTEMKYRVRAGSLPGFKLQSTGDTVTCVDPIGLLDALQAKYGPSVITASSFDACRKLVWSDLDNVIRVIHPTISKKKLDAMIDAVSAPYVTRVPKEPRIVREKTKEIE